MAENDLPLSELVAFAESDLSSEDVGAIRDVVVALAVSERSWTVGPPEFVDEVDEHGVRTTGLVHAFPAAKTSGGEPVPADVDRQAFEEVTAIIVALERLAASRLLVFGIDVDQDTVGWIDEGPSARLRKGLLDPWAANFADPGPN